MDDINVIDHTNGTLIIAVSKLGVNKTRKEAVFVRKAQVPELIEKLRPYETIPVEDVNNPRNAEVHRDLLNKAMRAKIAATKLEEELRVQHRLYEEFKSAYLEAEEAFARALNRVKNNESYNEGK